MTRSPNMRGTVLYRCGGQVRNHGGQVRNHGFRLDDVSGHLDSDSWDRNWVIICTSAFSLLLRVREGTMGSGLLARPPEGFKGVVVIACGMQKPWERVLSHPAMARTRPPSTCTARFCMKGQKPASKRQTLQKCIIYIRARWLLQGLGC